MALPAPSPVSALCSWVGETGRYHWLMSSRPAYNPFANLEGLRLEDSEHIVGDDDPDTALCGVDQTGVPWNQGFPVCQACLAVAQGRMN